ncbi:UNVERIFIED_CONTAM: hypothetical protein HHA_449240 [Hammondia hammondi]|eukprot:XP_008881833.1 hypothetical protein HHA_449240 [Hammondia hammondi]
MTDTDETLRRADRNERRNATAGHRRWRYQTHRNETERGRRQTDSRRTAKSENQQKKIWGRRDRGEDESEEENLEGTREEKEETRREEQQGRRGGKTRALEWSAAGRSRERLTEKKKKTCRVKRSLLFLRIPQRIAGCAAETTQKDSRINSRTLKRFSHVHAFLHSLCRQRTQKRENTPLLFPYTSSPPSLFARPSSNERGRRSREFSVCVPQDEEGAEEVTSFLLTGIKAAQYRVFVVQTLLLQPSLDGSSVRFHIFSPTSPVFSVLQLRQRLPLGCLSKIDEKSSRFTSFHPHSDLSSLRLRASVWSPPKTLLL